MFPRDDRFQTRVLFSFSFRLMFGSSFHGNTLELLQSSRWRQNHVIPNRFVFSKKIKKKGSLVELTSDSDLGYCRIFYLETDLDRLFICTDEPNHILLRLTLSLSRQYNPSRIHLTLSFLCHFINKGWRREDASNLSYHSAFWFGLVLVSHVHRLQTVVAFQNLFQHGTHIPEAVGYAEDVFSYQFRLLWTFFLLNLTCVVFVRYKKK